MSFKISSKSYTIVFFVIDPCDTAMVEKKYASKKLWSAEFMWVMIEKKKLKNIRTLNVTNFVLVYC